MGGHVGQCALRAQVLGYPDEGCGAAPGAADDTAPCDRQCRVSANVHTCGRLNVSFTCKELQDALKCDCSGCCGR